MIKRGFLRLFLVALLATLTVMPLGAQGEWLEFGVGLRPDSPFYFLEKIKEKIVLLFAFSPQKKAEAHLQLAEERLAEAEAMLTLKNPALVPSLLTEFQQNLTQSLIDLNTAESRGEKIESLKEKMLGAFLRHQTVLRNISERVVDSQRGAALSALSISRTGYQLIQIAFSEEKTEAIFQKVKERIPKLEELLPESFWRAQSSPAAEEASPSPAVPPL